jgi:hypothetical protein
MRATINNALARNLPFGNVDIRDTRLKGFILRVRETGYHSYRVEYGRGKRVTLGSIIELRPAEARRDARKILGDAARGIDPMAARRDAKAHTWGSFLSDVYQPWVVAKSRYGEDIVKRLRTHFEDLETLKLKDISCWHLDMLRSTRIKAGIMPGTINRDVAELKSALTKAVD